jgi:hypothetical protein
MAPIYDWRDLPFREIWLGDGEYYPGAGLRNGGVEGDPITPLCFVAYEMRSGRTVRLWQDQLGPFPPYRLDNEALICGYNLAAEFGFHIARGWGEPACALDAYIEFRHCTNDGSLKSGDREKCFYSLAGALRYFLEDEIDTARKDTARDRILQGPPFSNEEQREILTYCEDDVRALARLVPHLVPTIRSLPHALMRAKVQWATAKQALVRWPCGRASRCPKPPKSWRDCGPAFIASKIIATVSSTTPACILNSRRRSVGRCSVRAA